MSNFLIGLILQLKMLTLTTRNARHAANKVTEAARPLDRCFLR